MYIETYHKTLTYGQGKSLRHLVWFLVKGLNLKLNIGNIALDIVEYGQPGYGNTYRIRISYDK